MLVCFGCSFSVVFSFVVLAQKLDEQMRQAVNHHVQRNGHDWAQTDTGALPSGPEILSTAECLPEQKLFTLLELIEY